MKTVIQVLPGIKFVGWIDGTNLQKHVALGAICGMKVPVLTEVHEIKFFGHPECSCKSDKSGKESTETATLKFSTSQDLPRGRNMGFVVVDVNNRAYLIGSREHPWPVISSEKNAGTPESRSAETEVTVTHVALKTLIECIY